MTILINDSFVIQENKYLIFTIFEFHHKFIVSLLRWFFILLRGKMIPNFTLHVDVYGLTVFCFLSLSQHNKEEQVNSYYI